MASALVGAPRVQAPLLAGVSPAHHGQRRCAWAIDVAPILLATAIAFGVLQTGRTVDDLTGLPVSLRSLPSRLARTPSGLGVITVDLGRGRDPLDPALPAVTGPAVPRRARLAEAVTLIFDTGRQDKLGGTLPIGRSPQNTDGPSGTAAPHPLLGMADLSRTLAMTHALLEWSGSELSVTELNTTHGSLLVTPDGEHRPLPPGVRGAAGLGWTM